MAETPGPRVVIACEVMRPEIQAARPEQYGVTVDYLEQNLHRTPDRMPAILQEAVDRTAETASEIVLGYGICSNGIVGVRAPNTGLEVPRVHDCISLFLGSREAYDRAFRRRAGTYYLTPGWVKAKKDPLGMMEDDYVPRVGRKDAEWAIKEELKHYTHIVLIDTGTGDIEALRARALENARFLDKAYEEVRASSAFFEKIVRGPYDQGDFVFVEPGQKVIQDSFL